MGQQEVAVWLYDALGTWYPCSLVSLFPWSRHNYCPFPPEDRKRVLHPLPYLDFQSLESSCAQSHAGHPGLLGSHQWSLRLALHNLTLGFGISFSEFFLASLLWGAFLVLHSFGGWSWSILAASADGEVEGWANGEGEGESLALAGQRLAEIQTLGGQGAFISHRSHFQFKSELMKMLEQQNKSKIRIWNIWRRNVIHQPT